MARVLVVITPAEGHVNPSLGLVQQLVKCGEEVTYVCTEEYRKRIEATGAKVLTYTYARGSFADDPVLKPIIYKHPYQFIQFVLRGFIEPVIPEVFALTEQDSYDYLIYDYLIGWGGQMIAERLGIPAVCSITSFAFVKPLGSEHDVDGLDDEEIQSIYETTMNTARQLADRYQLSAPDIDDIFKAYGRLKIVHTSRYFQPQVEKLDDSYVFTGSSIAPRTDAPDFSLERDQLPYAHAVYISLGSILNNNIDFYKLCFEAFRNEPIQFILSSGKDTDMEPLAGHIPDNFIVKPYLPQLEVLQQVDAFITHAGMNSTSEALYYDVPLVMIPLTSDQPMVAQQVQKLGAGVIVDKDELTPAVLRNALLEVLNQSSYKQHARAIGESLRQAGGYERAAEMVMNVVGKAQSGPIPT
ncbi:macrolide family glycosyltransferase [Paenibacillus apiarius]|uniref:Glycosyl transferase n=1 Tax=Paenibacillus apiarius TaxID=46240 RepID=A0ABT4E1M3_9BACL|nr:macrolide family glycosyltransferase [Paenibacillus apiarius]MCY9517927.1 glycosyl transferase [Paenibacillus apiarius]MCY9523509.1 glycosyl transferase [Paenibacillus apiarius]MCY9555515.1 glycosyl transferase [Paenibacillus apiarius]MCY9561531.1 glycosyl transferase [Paenibacillus apiarius]MCY9686722.1 glycosyl transferase [Paenibacillus apiarius]